MSAAGISITTDLAIIVVLNPTPVETRIFTPADGRAFRGNPYFKRWVSEGQIFTHDFDAPIDFSRVIQDVCRIHSCSVVGFDRKQIPARAERMVDKLEVGKDHKDIPEAMRQLNSAAKGYAGMLYPEGSPMQHAWTSLPEKDGDRFLPTADNPATDRIDGVWALLFAMVANNCGRVYHEPTDQEKTEQAYLTYRAYKFIWIKHRFHGVIKVRPSDRRAMEWLGNGEAVLVRVVNPHEADYAG